MKKFGFTLAEVLITLGIIGVVAALTAPALVTSSRNQANAARLSVVVSNLENAFTTAIVTEGADNLYGTKMWSVVKELGADGRLGCNSDADKIAKFVGELGRYMYTNGFKARDFQDKKITSKTYYNGNGPYAMTSSGGSNTAAIQEFGDPFPIELKNGAVVFFRAFANGTGKNYTDNDIRKLGGSMMSNAADVFIDVNGKNSPNTIGRDVFTFYVGSNGILYPGGGNDVSIYDHGDRTEVWSNPDSIGDDGRGWACLPEQNIVANSGWGCTARVIEEGYQINY